MGMMVTKKQSSVHLVWFKRDLRLSDHKPLLAAARTGLPVLPLYVVEPDYCCLLYTSPSTRDRTRSRMPSSA